MKSDGNFVTDTNRTVDSRNVAIGMLSVEIVGQGVNLKNKKKTAIRNVLAEDEDWSGLNDSAFDLFTNDIHTSRIEVGKRIGHCDSIGSCDKASGEISIG